MAKRHEFLIDSYQADWIFRPLRCKRDVLIVLMRAVKYILAYRYLSPPNIVAGKIVLYVDKMSRLFFVSERRVFSIAMPFIVRSVDEVLQFGDAFHDSIDSKLTSEVLSFLENDPALVGADIWQFLEPISYQSEFDDGFWQFVRALLMYDDGYIRYDYDEKNQDGQRHPLHHLDVFYDGQSTFKLGLSPPFADDHLMDILDITTDCYFASKTKARA